MQDKPDDRDAEARVNAVKGLVSVCEILTQEKSVGSRPSGQDEMDLILLIKNEVMTSLLKALDDYSVDNRGDVGSWVREAAMDGLERCTYILCKRITGIPDEVEYSSELNDSDMVENNQSSSTFDANLATTVVGTICKQAVEKMDKLREAAAKVLQRILYCKIVYIPHIPYRKKLEEIVPKKTDLKWMVSRYVISSPVFLGSNLLSLSSPKRHFILASLHVGAHFFISTLCPIASVQLL